MLLIVPTDAPFALDPTDGVEVLAYDPEQNLTAEHLVADAAVVWGSPRRSSTSWSARRSCAGSRR
ncbi:MAG: hypothetical protein IPL41_17210 [Micropruina sp.]|nr:hypothetical protein [Micropruina sp.]